MNFSILSIVFHIDIYPLEFRWKNIFIKASTRPFQLFAQEPIIQILGIYMAFIYGLFYSLSLFPHLPLVFVYSGFPSVTLTILPNIFVDIYNDAPGIAGLHYIALGIGLTTSSLFNVLLLDRIYIHYKNKKGGVGEPEYRLRELISSLFSMRY